MPKIEVEILRTVAITREEAATVELSVPQRVLDDDSVSEWVMEKLAAPLENAVLKAVADADWGMSDELEEEAEYVEVNEV